MTKVHSDKGLKGKALHNVVEVKLTISFEKFSSLLRVVNITAKLKSDKKIMPFTSTIEKSSENMSV